MVCNAVLAGILNDLGSGGKVDLCVITKDGHRMLRGYEEGSFVPGAADYKRPTARTISRGTTAVLSSTFKKATASASGVEARAGTGAGGEVVRRRFVAFCLNITCRA